jgi:hypothetical protein
MALQDEEALSVRLRAIGVVLSSILAAVSDVRCALSGELAETFMIPARIRNFCAFDSRCGKTLIN